MFHQAMFDLFLRAISFSRFFSSIDVLLILTFLSRNIRRIVRCYKKFQKLITYEIDFGISTKRHLYVNIGIHSRKYLFSINNYFPQIVFFPQINNFWTKLEKKKLLLAGNNFFIFH